MPSLKIFVDATKDLSRKDYNIFNQVVINGLNAHGEHAVVAVVPDARVSGSGCYVELTCRHKPNRTPEVQRRLAEKLDKTAREVFGLTEPVRVRIIILEEFLLSGIN